MFDQKLLANIEILLLQYGIIQVYRTEINPPQMQGPYAQTRTLFQRFVYDDGQANHAVTYLMQLYSALPIRQAIVRQMQIAHNYEQLSPEHKNQFNTKAEELLGEDYEDVVVLNIWYMTNDQAYNLDLARYWQIQTTDLLKSSTYLKGSKGEKIPISNYFVLGGAQRGFRFIFPREYGGHEVLGSEDESLLLKFVYPILGDIGNSRIGFMEFKTQEMLFKGKIEY